MPTQNKKVRQLAGVPNLIPPEKQLVFVAQDQWKSRPRGLQNYGLFQNGATKATVFEHINNIAEWLFDNYDTDLIHMPDIPFIQRHEQVLAQDYKY